MTINERIDSLRGLMKKHNVHAFIIPSCDNHQGEYVGDYFKSRAWISGFTGSAGTVVITLNKSALWTDGRYHIQAAHQLQGSEVELFKDGLPGTKSYTQFIKDELKPGERVAFNGKVFSVNSLKALQFTLEDSGIEIVPEEDLIDLIWKDRPSIPKNKIFIHDVKFAGKSRVEKIKEVREEMAKHKATAYVFASLEDIIWLTNLRGSDVHNNPFFLSYVLLTNNCCTLYIDQEKVDDVTRKELEKDGLCIKNYDDIAKDLKTLNDNDKVIYDPSRLNVWLKSAIKNTIKVHEMRDITSDLKAIKNSVEIENTMKSQIRDGVAMVKFNKWLNDTIAKETITEISASDKLEEIRSQGENYMGLCFDTIAGYKENAAMMHYCATKDNFATLKPEHFFLVDSGAHYLDGTTDITRTFALGEFTDEEMEDYTLVLKGNIALSKAIFLNEAIGTSLDILARRPLWEKGLDYKCGTGHGVGFFSTVHEGPHQIRKNVVDVVLKPGMVVTNEPGVYKEGKHGIRIENDLLIEKAFETDCGTFLKFKAITFCPIDLKPVKKELLYSEEIQWLNDYHKEVFDRLSPYLNKEETAWLKEATRSI